MQHRFRKWFVADQATSHKSNHWWPSLLTHTCVIGTGWVKELSTLVQLPWYMYSLCINSSLFSNQVISHIIYINVQVPMIYMRSAWSWLLSGVPDYFDRNKILSGYDLSHYQVPHCIRVFFYFVWFVFIHHNFQFYFKLCTYCNILDIYLS